MVAINTTSTDIGIYWAYGRVLKNGPYFETERGEAVLKGCTLLPVRSPPLRGDTEQPQSMSDPDETRQCWSASYQIVRGDGGNDGVQDVDSVDGTMSAGGPLCGQVGWVALVVSAQENNGPVSGDALVGALTWQKYRVYDEYAVANGVFKLDVRMEPRGTHDILDSECVRRVEGGLSCSFSKRLLTNDRYDVTSESNNVFLLYGDYDEQRKRVVTKTVNLGR